jgi:Ribbon-helix-helix protein, copG family
MSADDELPLADDYVAKVDQWLASTDLSGLPEPVEPIELPPPDAPVTVVRPVRLPYEMDALVRALAEARGLSMSTLIREWIAAGLAATGQSSDPVTELRHSLDSARRALDELTGRRTATRDQRRAA